MSKLLAGRYELIEKIGEGGMAVVYKAKCRLLNRYVAIKILRPEFTKDDQFVENFKRESQAAACLQHPNIVSVFDVGKEGNIHFIVMELIDGKPLSDIIKEEAPFDYKRSIEITRQVASALSLAHKNNIIHRDVKPHNIMMTKDGTAKLADFGIAKAVSDSTLITETSRIIGSVHYFSPEQARGAYVDERSDIYSLGIVLYEMLTGQVPFDGDNPVQVALMHINDEITPPSQLVSGIPPALEKLVMKATDKFQSNRYRNAEELLEDLENIEFVTKMVGNSVFAASDVEEFQEMNRRKQAEPKDDDYAEKNVKKVKKKEKLQKQPEKKKELTESERTARKKRNIIIGVICAVIAGIAITALIAGSGVFGGVKVPDLKGMTPDKAEATLKRLELKMEIGEPITSDEVEKGEVAAQTPEADTKVDKGDTVTVMLSSGKPTGLVPRLVGRDFDEDTITAYLKANNYELGTVEEVESDEPVGRIISQDPGENVEAEKGTKVNLIISKGTDKISVPKLIGLTLDDARRALEERGLAMAEPSYAESTVYSKNIVMDANYGEGEKVPKGTVVKLTVSSGVPEVAPPAKPDNPDDNQGDVSGGDDDGNSDDGAGESEE